MKSNGKRINAVPSTLYPSLSPLHRKGRTKINAVKIYPVKVKLISSQSLSKTTTGIITHTSVRIAQPKPLNKKGSPIKFKFRKAIALNVANVTLIDHRE